MKLLAIECSAKPVSAAVIEDGKIISYAFSSINLTHSQTLFPIIENTLSAAKMTFSDIEAIGVATGPGSFTGLRIGIAGAKGLAQPKSLKCAGVSTLLSAAYMFKGRDAVICPVLDARCGQVYNALFKVNGEVIERLCDDRAVMIEDLVKEIKAITDKKVILCGDAAKAVFVAAGESENITLAPAPIIMQNATGVGLCAYDLISKGDFVSAADLTPAYLKLPQAERELNEKRGAKI